MHSNKASSGNNNRHMSTDDETKVFLGLTRYKIYFKNISLTNDTNNGVTRLFSAAAPRHWNKLPQIFILPLTKAFLNPSLKRIFLAVL